MTISENNFNKLLSTQLNLESHLLTESLDSVHWLRLDLRYTRSNEFDSRKLCENIKHTFEKYNKPLNNDERNKAVSNLNAMKAKFSRSKDSYKASECKKIIEEILGNIKDKNGDSKKTYFAPKEYYYATPTKTPEPISYTRASPVSWRRQPTETTTSNPTPAKVEPLANQQKHSEKTDKHRHKRNVVSSDSSKTHSSPSTHKKRRHKKDVEINATSIFASGAQQQRKNLRHVPKETQ